MLAVRIERHRINDADALQQPQRRIALLMKLERLGISGHEIWAADTLNEKGGSFLALAETR